MPVMATPPTEASLDYFVEWGGRAWRRGVEIGLQWLGDLSGLRVIDLGTRYGRMATLFALRGAWVTAVDVERGHLEVARDEARRFGVAERISFELYSGDPRDLPAGPYDVAFSKSVLVLMDREATLVEIHQHLVPRGRWLAVENARGVLPIHVLRMLRRRSLRPHEASYFTRRDVELARRHFDIDLEWWSILPPIAVLGGRKR